MTEANSVAIADAVAETDLEIQIDTAALAQANADAFSRVLSGTDFDRPFDVQALALAISEANAAAYSEANAAVIAEIKANGQTIDIDALALAINQANANFFDTAIANTTNHFDIDAFSLAIEQAISKVRIKNEFDVDVLARIINRGNQQIINALSNVDVNIDTRQLALLIAQANVQAFNQAVSNLDVQCTCNHGPQHRPGKPRPNNMYGQNIDNEPKFDSDTIKEMRERLLRGRR